MPSTQHQTPGGLSRQAAHARTRVEKIQAALEVTLKAVLATSLEESRHYSLAALQVLNAAPGKLGQSLINASVAYVAPPVQREPRAPAPPPASTDQANSRPPKSHPSKPGPASMLEHYVAGQVVTLRDAKQTTIGKLLWVFGKDYPVNKQGKVISETGTSQTPLTSIFTLAPGQDHYTYAAFNDDANQSSDDDDTDHPHQSSAA